MTITGSDFAEKWLESAHMCQNDTCEISSHSDQTFKIDGQKSKWSIHVNDWMRLIRFWMNSLAASDTNLITQYAGLECYHSICTGENSACTTGIQ